MRAKTQQTQQLEGAFAGLDRLPIEGGGPWDLRGEIDQVPMSSTFPPPAVHVVRARVVCELRHLGPIWSKAFEVRARILAHLRLSLPHRFSLETHSTQRNTLSNRGVVTNFPTQLGFFTPNFGWLKWG